LQGYLDRWAAETDHGERKGPFDEQNSPSRFFRALTGADVSWLAAQTRPDLARGVPVRFLSHLPLENLEMKRLFSFSVESCFSVMLGL
jgi:hypothetical protein